MAKKLSENAQTVLTFLQDHNGEDFTYKDIAEAIQLSPRSVTGTITGLQKKGLVERIPTEDDPKVKYIKATAEGLSIDVTADLAE
jgi:DNA-binding MarR family transcriptional regulator